MYDFLTSPTNSILYSFPFTSLGSSPKFRYIAEKKNKIPPTIRETLISKIKNLKVNNNEEFRIY